MKEDIWVIIPAYNEEKNISRLIKETKKYCKNIVVVDDGSKDKTFETAKSQESKIHEDYQKSKRFLKKEKVYVLKHVVNLGKGAAVITGSEFAIKKGAEILVYIDADLQHNPKEIPKFVEELRSVDVVFGIRRLNKNMPFILKFGNWFINKSTKYLYGIKLKDTQCGYRALTKDAYKKIKWKSNDYAMESEMIANIGKKHLRYKEIPIETIYSDKYKGTTIFDGIKIVINLFCWRFRKL